MDIDYDALANKFGATDASPNYDALASKFGGTDTGSTEQITPAATRPIDFSKVEEPGLIDRAALEADKILKSLGSVAPDWFPSRQDLVDVAAGMSEMGGALKGADRFKNVSSETGARTVGRFLDPVATLAGLKGYQAATKLPEIASLTPRVQALLAPLTSTPLRQSVVGGAGAGAAVGALHGEPLEGAAVGAGLGAAFRPLEILGTKAITLAADIKAGAEGQVVNYLDKLFGGNKQAVIESIQQLRSLISGERPTTGLAATINPEQALALKALELQGRGRNPQLFVGADEANAAARMAVPEAIAAPGARPSAEFGGRVPRSQAEAQRDTIVGKMYQEADREVVSADKQLMDLLGGDLVRPLVAKADKVLDQQITNQLTKGQTPAVEGIRGGRVIEGYGLPEWSVAGPNVAPQVVMPEVSIGAVRGVRKQLDDRIAMLDGPGLSAADKDAVSALKDARRQINAWLKDKSPLMREADATYQMLLPVQQQAQVGRQLANTLQTPTGKENLSGFLSAMRNEERTLRGAGLDDLQQLSQAMSPTQMRWLNQVEESARRQAEYAALPATREALPELRSALEHVEEMTPSLLKWIVTLARKGLQVKGKETTAEAQLILDKAAANPQFMLQLLNAELPKNRASLANAIQNRVRENRGFVTSEVEREK